jgi:Tfp pilus assembly protein PilF
LAGHALAGKTSEARQVLLQTITASGLEEPNESIWLVCGMIAEKFGVKDEAKAAYQRAVNEKGGDGNPAENGVIARKRLAALAR